MRDFFTKLPSKLTAAFRRSRFAGRPRLLGALLALVLLALALAIFLGARQGARQPRGPSSAAFKPLVTAARAQQRDVNIYLPALGTVTPLSTVTVNSRVDGQLMEVRFREGDMIAKDEVLAIIDPRPFQAQLAQAEGQLQRDAALLENAKLDLARYAQLVSGDLIAKQQYDTQASLVRQYEGIVKSDRGAIEAAKLQLTYSRITAPITGKAGLRLVDPGNIVRPGDQNSIVVLTQMQPIGVLFSLPEDNIARVLDKMQGGAPLKTEIYNREQSQLLAAGELTSLDNQIDPATGTLRLKALFSNDDMRLFPNQFVNVRLLIDMVRNAVVVPAAGVRRGPQGAQSYVLRDDDVVELRQVEVSESIRDEVLIRSGVRAGERVVIEGSERLRDGVQVEAKDADAPETPRQRQEQQRK
ncbi:MAG: MdtA/MuxA family multidrug efflux RND transporter periplasmic adaptor subunit [Deltaproteobacteria bacterium]|jgi:multidrug efflux system membrane fusion protein|nr:MdtA/MuxA family multidrug efflux RND transporter periplasmic adaptor subunit [Deltaproteobacteria bacterium]